ncbi:MAG TPA: NAD(P)-dependent oxidoreductase [Terriglobales bacterium]|nr:NAD(P)-dependent oxidoreductase [Terriglobales bacterium]
MKIAFLGTGNMGLPMARNLGKAGHEVTVWNRTRSKANEIKDAKIAVTPAEAVSGVEVAFTMLADDAAVESVVFGERGILAGLPKNAIHVSSSTISVALSKRMAAAHLRQGQRYLAAPVFGRPEAAAGAKLFIVAAGETNAIAECQPLFSALGQGTTIIGDEPHLANVVKLTGNFMIATIIELLGEALALGRKHGIEAQAMVDFFTATLFSAPVFKTYGGLIANEKYEPAGFKLRLGLKDVRLALAAADAAEVPLPLASLIHDQALAGIGNNLGDKDWSALAKVAARNAGLESD